MLSRSPSCPRSRRRDLVDGQVTKVDASAGKITIKHGPMKKFDMDDGMTMVFRAGDPAMLKAVKAGDKVKFDADAHQRAVHRHEDREGEVAAVCSDPSAPLGRPVSRLAVSRYGVRSREPVPPSTVPNAPSAPQDPNFDGSAAAIRKAVAGKTCVGQDVLTFGESGPGSPGTFKRIGRLTGTYEIGYDTILIIAEAICTDT